MDLSQKAKEIISKILYITIATVDANGDPWNAPVYSAFDDKYNFYFRSNQTSQHCKNIAANENVFLVIYDSQAIWGEGKGVYVKAKAKMLTDVLEVKKRLEVLDKRVGKPVKDPQLFLGNNVHRVYKITPETFWVNQDKIVDGKFFDERVEVKL